MGKMEIIKVLESLKVTNYEDIDKYKALEIALLFPKISEQAFTTLFNLVPNFFELLHQGLEAEKEVVNKSLELNSENMKSFNTHIELVLEVIKGCIQKPDLSFEELKYLMDKMNDILVISSQKDTENKNFIDRNVKIISDRNNSNKDVALKLLAGLAGVGLVAAGFISDNSHLTNISTKKLANNIINLADKKGLIK